MRKIRFKRLISSIQYGTFASGEVKPVPDEFAKHCVDELTDVAEYVDSPADTAPKKRENTKRRVAKNVERTRNADSGSD